MKQFWGIFIVFFLFIGCKSNIKPEILHGKWLYYKVEYISKKPVELMPAADLQEQKPSIVFRKNGRLVINSRGKTLSKGKYILDGDIIRFTEKLPKNQTREIAFKIIDLTKNELVFESLDSDPIKISAKKK